MKKLTVVLMAILCAFAFAGCADKDGAGTPAALEVYAPDGAPAIGMSKLIHDSYAGARFHVVPPENIGGTVLAGTADIAIMPTNAAALLHAKGADIAMLGVTNFGSLYIMGTGDATALQDLKGQVVYSIGQGNVPDLVFRYVLRQANIPYRFADTVQEGTVSLAYVSEGSAIVGGFTAGKMQYGVISEPAATVAQNKASAKRLMNLQTLYENATNTTHGFPQAALVVKKSLLQTRAADIEAFVQAFAQGAKWAETAPAAALEAIKSAGSSAVPMLNANIAKGCNLGFERAFGIKENILAFYAALDSVKEQGETPVGGTLPGDDFFLYIPADVPTAA